MDGLADCSDLAQLPEQEPRRNQPSPALQANLDTHRRGTHTTLNKTTHIAPIGTWWLELQFCFRDINPAYNSTALESA
jgi:hypothetical protein